MLHVLLGTADMDSQIMVESLPLLGVCNLCLSDGTVRSMFHLCKIDEKSVTYSEMLMKCFSIDASLIELGDTKRVICDGCCVKLADCTAFRKQVEESLHTLETTAQLQKETLNVKPEVVEYFDEDFNMDFDDDDDILLKDIAIKKEPKEEFTLKLKSKKKLDVREPVEMRREITIKLVKKSNIAETESMLAVGLFPFKLKTNGKFNCAICPENSSNLEDIRNHIVQHDKTNIHRAFKKMFSNSNRFYKNASILRCKICTTDLHNFEELKDHIENCTRLKGNWNDLPFKLKKDQLDCPVCKKTFLNFVSLNTHMNSHYPNFVCEQCGKAFASKARLRGHTRTHEVGDFPCKYCDAVFDKVTKRENHVSKEHKSGVRYACQRCKISLTSFYARQKHLAEVHNEELKRYKCKACPQSYITPGHLSSHVRRDHLNERNHKCDKCDLAFYTKNALKMHMIKHDGKRIHSCNVCSKSYQRKKTLIEHMRIHNNDKRFICPVCGRAFTQKCTLKGHLKVHERKVEIDDRVMQPLHSI